MYKSQGGVWLSGRAALKALGPVPGTTDKTTITAQQDINKQTNKTSQPLETVPPAGHWPETEESG